MGWGFDQRYKSGSACLVGGLTREGIGEDMGNDMGKDMGKDMGNDTHLQGCKIGLATGDWDWPISSLV